MSFDPEKVERWDIYPSVDDKEYFFAERVGSEIHRSPNAREFVPATEYDQLLALYRNAVDSLEQHGGDSWSALYPAWTDRETP